MTHRRVSVLWVAVFVGACSDPPELDPGTFRVQLLGAATGALSGSAVAETIFAEDFPGPRYSIRMYAAQGDTVRGVSVHCAGDGPPPSGTYEITATGEECGGLYVRAISSLEDGTRTLERAEASSGTVTITESGEGQVVGSFSLSGDLFLGSEPAGTMTASGSFSATDLR